MTRRQRSPILVYQYLLLLTVLCFVSICNVSGLDLGKLFKKPRRHSQKEVALSGPSNDPEEKADEVLSYKTACDRQLAQTIVILGEQKEAAEEALTICREHRATSRSDVDYLVKKVDIQMKDIEQADERCDEKLVLVKKDGEENLLSVQETLNETMASMELLKEEHEAAMEELKQTHQSTIQELETKHSNHVQEIKNQHNTEKDDMNQELEGQKRERLLERQTSETQLQTTKEEHEKTLKSIQKEHKSVLDAKEQTAKQTLEQTQTQLNTQIKSLTKQSRTCDTSLNNSQKAHQALQKEHERALQKIAVLEDLTAWALFKEEVRDFAQAAEKELEAIFMPLYEHYKIRDKLDVANKHYTKVKTTAVPVLRPVLRPLEKGTQRLIQLHREIAEAAFEKPRQWFVQEFCPKAKQRLRNKKTRQLLNNYHSHWKKAVEEACGNPTESIQQAGYVLLILLVFLCRWFILRCIVGLILLPFSVLVLSFRMISDKAKAKKDDDEDGDSKEKQQKNSNTIKNGTGASHQPKMKNGGKHQPSTPVSSNKTEASDEKTAMTKTETPALEGETQQ